MNVDNGPAEVLVFLAGQGAVDASELLLPGGVTADVFVDEEDNTLVQVGAGTASSAELVRAVLRSPHCRIDADPFDLVVQCAGGYDRFVLSADLAHELLWTRQWEQREQQGGPNVVVIGQAPIETTDRSSDEAAHTELGRILGAVSEVVGPAGQLHTVNLFTRRTAPGVRCEGRPADRHPDQQTRAAALEAADAVVAAWGPVPSGGDWAAEEMVEELRRCRDTGALVLVPGVDGRPHVAGQPPQPTMPRGRAEVIDAPSDWLWGAPLR